MFCLCSKMSPTTAPLAIRYPTAWPARSTAPETDRALTARCTIPACGAVTVLEMDTGLRRYLEGASLNRLEDQLRCTCGARTGRLAFGSAKPPPPPGRGRMYLFLV